METLTHWKKRPSTSRPPTSLHGNYSTNDSRNSCKNSHKRAQSSWPFRLNGTYEKSDPLPCCFHRNQLYLLNLNYSNKCSYFSAWFPWQPPRHYDRFETRRNRRSALTWWFVLRNLGGFCILSRACGGPEGGWRLSWLRGLWGWAVGFMK